MRWHFLLLIGCLVAQAALADDGAAPLRLLLDKSDVVVLGKFTSDVFGENDESGVVHYLGEFQIEQLIKGAALGQRREGGTITVNAIRYELQPGDRAAELNKGARAILFLTCNDRQSPPTYLASDNWLGVQPPSSTLAKALTAMANDGPRPAAIAGLSAAGRQILADVKPVEVAKEFVQREGLAVHEFRLDQPAVHAYCPPQPTMYDWLVSFPRRSGEVPLLVAVTNARRAWRLDPQSLERIGGAAAADAKDVAAKGAVAAPRATPQSQLAGRWRMFLPGGFEYQITLTAEKDDRYRLAPGGFTFGSNYEVQGDSLVSVAGGEGEEGKVPQGVFKWKIQSPYLLTLVEQPAKSSSDYLGAVLFRPSPAAELRLEREKPKGTAAWVPQTTLAELDRMVEAGDYTRVRKQMLGYQLESIGVVRSVSPSHPDWVLVDLPGKHWGAILHNVHADHGLKPGSKVKFRGMIVSEGYSSLTLWLYESKNVGFYTAEGTDLKFHHKQAY